MNVQRANMNRRYDPYYEQPEPEISYRNLSSKHVTTRKPHDCRWCRKPILIGTRAEKHVYLSEGEFYSEYQHINCQYHED